MSIGCVVLNLISPLNKGASKDILLRTEKGGNMVEVDMTWRTHAWSDWEEVSDERLMIQQFVFYMEELVKLLRQPKPDVEGIVGWLECELATAKKEMEW